MNEIIGFYVLNSEGDVIFIHEKYIQGSEHAIQIMWPRFLVAFQLFISELGANESKIVFENNKIYTSFDEKLDVHFVLKCTRIAKTPKMKDILKKTIKLFREETSKFESLFDLDSLFLTSLAVKVKDILDPVKPFDELLVDF